MAAEIKFRFDEKKATAAAALLLKLAGGKMGYQRLLALLWLAELESFKRRGWPIIGGDYVNVPDDQM